MSHKSAAFNRRHFLKSAGAIAAASVLPAWFIEEQRSYAQSTKPLSPNDKPNIALVGCGGQGRGDAKRAQQFGNVIAVCDVDQKHAEQAAKQFEGAKAYSDFRKVIERDDIHVIITGTPDHWHTLVNLAAVKAGKDVYSEKPLTLTIDEGKRLIKAVRDNNRILQTGTQQRSDARFRLACELVRNGRIGKLTQIWVGLPAGLRGGPFKPAPAPPELNWDFWLGQAPQVEYVPQRCHFSFRYWWDYSGGTMTDWGAHHNDIALWAMGLDRSGPVSVEGKALVEPIPGGYTAVSEYRLEYTYANGVKHICETLTTDSPTGQYLKEPEPGKFHNGLKFEGTEGWIFVNRGEIRASKPELIKEPLPAGAERLYVSDNHMENFFDCVRSRKQPVAEVEIGHRSASVCHLGVIAIRLGRKLNWDPTKEEFVGDKGANAYVAREMRKPWTYEMI
jgi:predicted dehydrogenase